MDLSSADFIFQDQFFFYIKPSGISVECQAGWIQIMPDVLLGLIRVQIVCKGYQQTTLVSKEFMTMIQANCCELTRNSQWRIYIKLKEHHTFAC